MLLRRTPLLVVAVLLLAAPAALAEPPPDFEADREAGYLGLSGLYAHEVVESGFWKRGVRLGNSGGISARMGYRMFRWVAAEIEGGWVNGLGKGIKNPWNVTANLKVIYPLGPQDRIQPFIVGGAGVISAEIIRTPNPITLTPTSNIETEGVWKLGAGVDYFVTRNWVASVGATWLVAMPDRSDLAYVAVKAGITYNFR